MEAAPLTDGDEDGAALADMERYSNLSSLPFRLALFYAVNPDEELSSGDVALKFGVPPRDVQKRLKNAVDQGIFACTAAGPGRGKQSVYTAGPVLLHMVGGKLQREMIAACMPIRVRRVTVVRLVTDGSGGAE